MLLTATRAQSDETKDLPHRWCFDGASLFGRSDISAVLHMGRFSSRSYSVFLRQSQRGYDSLSAADYPDLAAAVIYYPVIGWILSRASRKGTLRRTAIRIAIWHIVAIGLAVFTATVRNRLWGFG